MQIYYIYIYVRMRIKLIFDSWTGREKGSNQMDGEPFGFTPAEIEVVPQILPMIAP